MAVQSCSFFAGLVFCIAEVPWSHMTAGQLVSNLACFYITDTKREPKHLNHSACSFCRTCERTKQQLPLVMPGWQECLWFAKTLAVDRHSNPSCTGGALRYRRFYFDHSWMFSRELGFQVALFIVHNRERQKYLKREENEYVLSSFLKANKHHMLPSAVQGAPQEITDQREGIENKPSGFSFYRRFPAPIYFLEPDPLRQFVTWISALLWSFISLYFVCPPATHCPHTGEVQLVRVSGRNCGRVIKAWNWGLKSLSKSLEKSLRFFCPYSTLLTRKMVLR